MTSALLMFLMLIKAQSVSSLPSCPASCLVCSEEAVVCQRLTYIIDAPQTTRALLLNEGSISTVQPRDLSDLGNISVISLSHNRISALDRRSFRNMPFLQTLLLDHNLLTLQALEGGALTNLTQLEVLALGNNRIDRINPGLFRGTASLRILKLEGNQITRLESGSFPLNGLRVLESLDLSDNFIDYLDKNSFRGLISLTALDLSRNRLRSAPSQPFSYLTLLDALNLDLNPWNCSCPLLELTAFLSSFIQEPDKTLHNGRRMACVSADNPTVSTVLELTEANCVPSNQNVTVRADARGSVSPQIYVRDLAITGAVCFAGGVSLTLLVVLICYKVSKKKKQKEQQTQEEVKEEESTTVSNHIRNHTDAAERRRNFVGANDPADASVGPRTAVANGGQFRCPECRGEEPVPTPVRWERMNGRVETLDDRERQRMRVEDDRRRIGPPQQRIMGRHLVGNLEGQNRPDLLHCGSCHRAYRPNQTDQNVRQARFPHRENSPMHGFHQQRPGDWGRNSIYGDFDLRNLKRETRNVTFALESPRKSQGVDRESEEATSPRGRQDGKNKLQSGRPIKVKLNLNPLRRSKVHPKLKGDEKGSPRKSKDKSEGRKDRKKSKKGEKQKKSSEQETVQAQVVPPNPMAHMQGFLGAQFRGGGMLLGNRAGNLLGASGPQMPPGGLPFPGGNFMAQGKPMFPGANPMAPNMNLSGPSVGPGGIPAMGLVASPNSSLANVVQGKQAPLQASPATLQANPASSQASANRIQANAGTLQPNVNVLQANPAASQGNTVVQASTSSAKQVSPTIPAKATSQGSVTAKQATSLSANSSSQSLQDLAALAPPASSSAAQSDSKLSPKSSPRGQPKTPQEPVPQSSGKGKSEAPTSPRKGSQSSVVADSSQTTTSRTMVKNMSTTSLTESVHGEAKGVVSQAEPPAGEVAAAAGGAQGADVSVSSVSGLAESAENNASAVLIQQEYLSEDGRSSPRMKLRLVIPEKATNRPPTALERKLR